VSAPSVKADIAIKKSIDRINRQIMEEVTIISYPGPRKNNLLSMAQMRSRYMMPFGGRSRVVDFTIRNSMVSGARKMIIFNNWAADLEDYVENYGPFRGTKFPC
jgi:ADP-glucose pyrophosphorylase